MPYIYFLNVTATIPFMSSPNVGARLNDDGGPTTISRKKVACGLSREGTMDAVGKGDDQQPPPGKYYLLT